MCVCVCVCLCVCVCVCVCEGHMLPYAPFYFPSFLPLHLSACLSACLSHKIHCLPACLSDSCQPISIPLSVSSCSHLHPQAYLPHHLHRRVAEGHEGSTEEFYCPLPYGGVVNGFRVLFCPQSSVRQQRWFCQGGYVSLCNIIYS